MNEIIEENKLDKQNLRSRRRKKHKFNQIRTQMEFYFGDANLTKDRFLKKLIDEDPFVPLDVFLTFNRMKTLTQSTEDIAKALQKSDFLELSEDKTRVRRISKIIEKEDLDDYVIYVESLPPHTSHDWLKDAFTIFGPVAYVSLPRYKNKKIKGFAFIEFEQKSSVEKALSAFEEFHGLITIDKKPEELISIVTFNKENTQDENNSIIKENNKIENSNEILESSKEIDTDVSSPPRKKHKENHEINDENKIFEDKDSNPATELEIMETDESKVKPKRKRIRRKKIDLPTVNYDDNITDLRITAKSTWKKLRNKYLNLQREKVKQMKQNLKKNRPVQSKTSPMSHVKSPQNINFYGALNENCKKENEKIDQTKVKSKAEILNKKPLFNLEHGIIVSIKFNEPCVDIKDFKSEIKQYSQVKYVDIHEGAFEAFIRTESADSSNELIKQISCPEYSCTILNGTDEEMYWEKIKKDREDKLLKKVKVIPSKDKSFGKIIKQATHIRFDENNDE